jgi:ABC-type polysaccharide/polyol phosphate transport system ATPase subunit
MKSIENMCNRVAWLDHGNTIQIGDPTQIIPEFEKFMDVLRNRI